jgi:hypothetical protein
LKDISTKIEKDLSSASTSICYDLTYVCPWLPNSAAVRGREKAMSLLTIAPDIVSAASTNLENLGSELRRANAAAAGQTTAIAAPAADEVSAAITSLFGAHAQEFQAVSARAAAFHDEFVNLLSGGATQYVSAEVAGVQQMWGNMVNAPLQVLPNAAAATSIANAADSQVSIFNQTYGLGPIQLKLGDTTIISHDGSSSAYYGGSLTLNTPFGSLPLTSCQGRSFNTGEGPFAGNLYFSTSFGSTGAEIEGIATDSGLLLPTMVRSVTIAGYTFGSQPYH